MCEGQGGGALRTSRLGRRCRPGEGCGANLLEQGQDRSADTAQHESGGVEVAQAAQPRLFLPLLGVGEDPGDDHVEQVEHVVLRTRLERAHEGEERRDPTLIRKPHDRLRLGCGREAGEREHP